MINKRRKTQLTLRTVAVKAKMVLNWAIMRRTTKMIKASLQLETSSMSIQVSTPLSMVLTGRILFSWSVTIKTIATFRPFTTLITGRHGRNTILIMHTLIQVRTRCLKKKSIEFLSAWWTLTLAALTDHEKKRKISKKLKSCLRNKKDRLISREAQAA